MSSKINVLQISVRADIGGGPKHLLDILNHNSHENVKLFSAIPFKEYNSANIQKYSQNSIQIPHRKFSIISFLRLYLFCKKNNITIIHSHGRGAGYYSRPLKLFGLKIIHTLHGAHIEKTFKGRIKVIVDQVLKYLTDLSICVSESEYEKALKHRLILKEKFTIIHNGVKVVKQQKRLPSYTSKIAMLGRLSYPKGYDILIDYIARFVEENPQYTFSINIAGDGEDREKITKLINSKANIKNYIHLLGETSKPLIFLRENDAFISSSRFEGMPISLLEAISVGLPCLVSNVVGNKDIITQKNGYLFRLDDYNSFQGAFIKLLTKNHQDKVRQALIDLNNKFNIKKQVNKIITVYLS